jgi:hypothetical protein
MLVKGMLELILTGVKAVQSSARVELRSVPAYDARIREASVL